MTSFSMKKLDYVHRSREAIKRDVDDAEETELIIEYGLKQFM